MSSREVAEAVGLEGETREQKRARLRKIMQEPSEREIALRETMAMDAEDAVQAQAELQADAKARVLGMVRAITGEMRSLEGDDARVLLAARAYVAAMETLDARFLKINGWCHAVRAVVAVYGLEMPALPTPSVPAQHPEVDKARVMVAHVPVRATGYIREELTDGSTGQRTFAEVDDAEARELIKRKIGR